MDCKCCLEYVFFRSERDVGMSAVIESPRMTKTTCECCCWVDSLSDFLIVALNIAKLSTLTKGSCGKVVVASC